MIAISISLGLLDLTNEPNNITLLISENRDNLYLIL